MRGNDPTPSTTKKYRVVTKRWKIMVAVESEIGHRHLLVPQHLTSHCATQLLHAWSVSLWGFVCGYHGEAQSVPPCQKIEPRAI
jgi:hypothetical protein